MSKFNYYFITIALLLAVMVLSACRNSPAAPPVTASEPGLDGLWAWDGYGYIVEIEGDQLQFYEVTTVSCLPSLSGELQSGDFGSGEDAGLEALAQIPMGDLTLRMQVLAGASPDEKRFHVEGTASSVAAQRISELPANCEATLPDSAEATFDVFWQTYFEHYPFFAMKGVDWEAVRREYRPQITAETTDEELFEIFQQMIEPLQDAQTTLYAPSLENGWFEGRRPDSNPLTDEDRARSAEIIETEYLRSPLQQWLNGQVAFAMLDGDVGYLRISGFIGYTDDGDFQADLEALETALDEIFNESENLKGLVIDVRLNDGGWDEYGLAIAGRLTESEYLAYTKQARNDPTDPDQWTVPQPSLVRPSSRPGYLGPVVLLTGPDSISAAETFTMALMGRELEVIRIGEKTQGVFSDVPFRTLPNGWLFGVPNERYLTEGGQSFDGLGIPPDITVPVFPPGDLESGRDGALEKALEHLMGGSPSSLPAKSAMAAVGDISIYYELHGQGEPLLLLHGGTGCTEVWNWGNQFEVLGEHYRVIAPDSRAHGRTTDSEQPLSYRLMADDIVGLLDHLGVESAYVVGWSDGGNTGLDMAIRYPERVRGLVATGAQFRADGMIPEELEWTETLSVESFPEEWLDMCYRSIAPDPAHLPVMLDKLRGMWLTEEYVSVEGLGTITVPVLLLEGAIPDFVQTEHTEALAAAIPGAKLQWIEETGHARVADADAV